MTKLLSRILMCVVLHAPAGAAERDIAITIEVYRFSEDYIGRGGFSWIHRWTRTQGLPIKAEPEPPAWVREAWSAR